MACTEGYHSESASDGHGGGRGDGITLQSLTLHPKELEMIRLPKSTIPINDKVLADIRRKNKFNSVKKKVEASDHVSDDNVSDHTISHRH